MNSLKPVLNVHLIPVGLEIDRAVLPLKETKADKVYLLFQEDPPEVTEYYLDNIRQGLKEAGLKEEDIKEAKFEQWDDFQGIMSKISEVMKKEKEKGNKVFVNISSGGKLLGIAGTLMASMYDVKAYYVIPEEYKKWNKEPQTEGFKEAVMIPEYNIEPPEDKLVYALWVIDQYGRTSQKNLAQELADKELLRTEDEKGSELSTQAFHSLFRRQFLKPLEEKGWVTRKGERRGSRVYLTEDGENVLKIFKKSNEFIKS